MPKNYKDLSRRGLIKLNSDFDEANNNQLHDFLSDNEANYEGVRPVEKIIETCDSIRDSISGSGSLIKQGILKSVDSVLDTALNSITALSNSGK